jgi:hypothetical protein
VAAAIVHYSLVAELSMTGAGIGLSCGSFGFFTVNIRVRPESRSGPSNTTPVLAATE